MILASHKSAGRSHQAEELSYNKIEKGYDMKIYELTLFFKYKVISFLDVSVSFKVLTILYDSGFWIWHPLPIPNSAMATLKIYLTPARNYIKSSKHLPFLNRKCLYNNLISNIVDHKKLFYINQLHLWVSNHLKPNLKVKMCWQKIFYS